MAEHAVNPSAGERRVALEKRQSVAEMSPEEMRQELLTSELTGLPNRRAFDEAKVSSAVAMSDVDGLKALNKHGYQAGNAVLKAMADVLREAGLEAYHDKGDEFLCRGHSIKELVAKLEHARGIFRDRNIVVERADGSTLSITGADFGYGVGKDPAGCGKTRFEASAVPQDSLVSTRQPDRKKVCVDKTSSSWTCSATSAQSRECPKTTPCGLFFIILYKTSRDILYTSARA